MLMRGGQFFMGTWAEDGFFEMGVKEVEFGDREEGGVEELSWLGKEFDEGGDRSERMGEGRDVLAVAKVLSGVGDRF